MLDTQSPQSLIETKMREISEVGHYEMIQLLSSEGLPLAEHYGQQVIKKDRLAEMSILFHEVRKMADVMGKISNVKEVVVEGYSGRKIVFRFFHALNQDVILAVVVPPKKAFRGRTNSLIKVIEKIPF
jgi:hypothetical protein